MKLIFPQAEAFIIKTNFLFFQLKISCRKLPHQEQQHVSTES